MSMISETLDCAIQLVFHIENGNGIQTASERYLKSTPCTCSFEFSKVLLESNYPEDQQNAIQEIKSIYRRTLFTLVLAGLNGAAVLPRLKEVRDEIIEQSYVDMEKHIQRLPIIGLLPMILFVVPSILILFGVPMMESLSQGGF